MANEEAKKIADCLVNVALVCSEIVDQNGDAPVLLSNILRCWSPEKRERVARSLLGNTSVRAGVMKRKRGDE